MLLKEHSLGWQKKIATAADQEKRLKDLALLKTTCVDGKVLEFPYVKTLQNITDDRSFQNFKFNSVDRAKISICNNTIIWTDKIIACVKNRFEDDSHKDILQAAYEVLNSWTVMVVTPKKNTTESRGKTEQWQRQGK